MLLSTKNVDVLALPTWVRDRRSQENLFTKKMQIVNNFFCIFDKNYLQ